MPRNDALALAAARGSAVSPPPVSAGVAGGSGSDNALTRLSSLQSLLWKEDAVKSREKATLARLEGTTRDISALTLEILGLRDAVTTALRTSTDLQIGRAGGGSRPLGYQQEQAYRKLVLSAQAEPRTLARALIAWERTQLELGDAGDAFADVANFLVYHLFPRCDRCSHSDAAGVLELIDELHAAAVEDAADVAELFGRDTLLTHVWGVYFRRTGKPFFSQALREMIVNIAAMPDPPSRTPNRTPARTPAPAVNLEQNASASRTMQDSPVGRFLLPSSTPNRTPQTSARKSMSDAWRGMTTGTPAAGGGRGGAAPQTPMTPATPSRYPPVPLDTLLAFGKKIISCIVDNAETVPKELRWIMRSAWEHAGSKFGTEESEVDDGQLHHVMSVLLYESLLSEAVVFPELSGSMEPLEVNPPTRAKLQQIECVLRAAFTGEDLVRLTESSGITLDGVGGDDEAEMIREKLAATLKDRHTFVDKLVAAPPAGEELAILRSPAGSASAGLQRTQTVVLSGGDEATELEWPIAVYPNDLYVMHQALEAYCGENSEATGAGEHSASPALCGLLREMGSAPALLPPQRNNLFAMLPRFKSIAGQEADKGLKQLAGAERQSAEEQAAAKTREQTKKKLRAVVKGLPRSAFAERGGDRAGTCLPLLDMVMQQRGEVLSSTGGSIKSNALYEVYLSLDSLPPADKENNFLPFIEEVCAESEQVIHAYSMYGLDAQDGSRVNGVGEEYVFHLRQETEVLQHQKGELGEHVAQLQVRKVATPHARQIQTAVKSWLATPCPDCAGESDINEDAFLCEACCRHMTDINTRVRDFLGRFDRDLDRDPANMVPGSGWAPTVGLRLADWAISRAHESLFPLCEQNGAFERHMQSLQFITPDYGTFYSYLMEDYGGGGGDDETQAPMLVHENSLLLVMQELLRINDFRGPNRKLECIVNFWKGIVELLSLTVGMPAADDYLPLLSYVTLKASPKNLLSNLQYIYTFREVDIQGRSPTAGYERALVDFGQAVKCLKRLRPRRMSPDTPLTPVQSRLKEAAIAMDFAEEDVLLALRQLPAEDAALDEDAAAFKRCKMKVCASLRAYVTLVEFCGGSGAHLPLAPAVQMLDWLTAAEELKTLEEEQHGVGHSSDSAARFEALIDNLVGDEPDEPGVIEGALRHLNFGRR